MLSKRMIILLAFVLTLSLSAASIADALQIGVLAISPQPIGALGSCTYSITPASSAATFGATGGSGAITITPSSETCSQGWVATSDSAWLTFGYTCSTGICNSSTIAGIGSGTISYKVAPNTGGTDLRGSISISVLTVPFVVTVQGNSCISCNTTLGDVTASDSFRDYIHSIACAGITQGCGNGNYCPAKDVTRAQMAAFIVRAKEGEPPADYCTAGSTFNDISSGGGFCKYINRLGELHITTGCGAGNYCPDEYVTRGQMAAFLVRAVSGEPPSDYCSSGSPFSDVDSSSIYCKYIKKLKELGITTGCGNGNYCPSGNVTRDQMAAFLFRAFLSNSCPITPCTTAAVSATVTDLATGQPLQGAAVTAGTRTATTDATGSAVFSGLPSNQNQTTPITISATAAGYPPAQTTTALLACGTTAAASVLLVPESIAGFQQQIVNLSNQVEQGQISDDDFLLQFSNLLQAIDRTFNGPQLLQTYLNDVVLGSGLTTSATRVSRHSQYSRSLTVNLSGNSTGSSSTTWQDSINYIENSQAYLMITTFIKTVMGQLATAGIPEPAATMYSAAEPEIVRGILTVEYRKEIDNICLGNGALQSTCDDAYQKFSNGDPAGALVEVFNAAGKPLPSYMATPATVCTYIYSDWSACQSDSTQARTVISSSSAGCVGKPVLTQSCTFTPPACTYTYSNWSACQSDNTQTRTVISSSPTGCVGTSVSSQSCTYASPTLPGAVILTATPGCNQTTSGIWLAWTVSSNADSYDVYRNGSLYGSGFTGAQYTDTSVTAGTFYTYYVAARNVYGSTTSNAISATAKTCTTSPFQGNITGGWSGSCSGYGSVSGGFSMSIGANGSITGSYSGDSAGSINGSVDTSGSFSANGTAAGGASWAGHFSIIGGTLLSGDGSWSASGCSGGWSGTGGLTQ